MIRRILWYVTTGKWRFLQSPKYGKYYWCRLHARKKKVCKDFGIKTLGWYHNLHGQSHILLLADVFENFQNMFIEIKKLDPARFLTAPG